MRYASFGSISHGTLSTEDLLQAFANELDYQIKRQPRSVKRAGYRKLIREALKIDPESEGASDLVNDLIDALDTFAPPYAYFGSHPGDGSDFGYWLTDEMQEVFDGLQVNDTGEVPRGYRGEVLHVNDHGNMTLYVSNGRGKLKEIWGIV